MLAFLQGANNAQATLSSTGLAPTPAVAIDETVAASDGPAIYAQTCIACHGAEGTGAIPGVPDFTAKESPLVKSDAELQRNISDGFQSPGSFMAMPAKGGNPALTEADIRAVLFFLRLEFGT